MSAWIVSRAHIDALVSAAVQNGVISDVDDDDAKIIGQMLWKENHRSINFRYGDKTRTPRYEPMLFRDDVDPVVALKLLACLNYQTCESPDYTTTHAYTWIRLLRAVLEAREDVDTTPVPSRYGGEPVPAYSTSDEYTKAPWGIDSTAQLRVLR